MSLLEITPNLKETLLHRGVWHEVKKIFKQKFRLYSEENMVIGEFIWKPTNLSL